MGVASHFHNHKTQPVDLHEELLAAINVNLFNKIVKLIRIKKVLVDNFLAPLPFSKGASLLPERADQRQIMESDWSTLGRVFSP